VGLAVNAHGEELSMTTHRSRGAWLAAVAIVLSAGLAPPARANHLMPADVAQEQQARPIQLGVSGSSQTFLLIKGLLYCYAGTLGSLVQDANHQYILSNNHVLAKENGKLDYNVPSASANATIIQPGLLDEGPCTLDSGEPGNAVAVLSRSVDIAFARGKNKPANTVDAAIAEVDLNQVDSSGTILGIGPVAGSTAATLSMPVQKTGRTTAHTFGTVLATNVTVDIAYDSGTARFVNQIRIRRPCGDAGFSDAGDSGSLIVTVPTAGDPMAVGLLFAGGGSDTFANPIGPVLQSLGVSMVTGGDGNTTGAMRSDYNDIVNSCPPSGGGMPGHGRPKGTPPGLAKAKDVQTRHSNAIFALPDVVGHGVGADENGDAVIEIYVKTKGKQGAGGHPSDIEGVPVRVIETGPIRAF
jgi:hypothetical protein